MASRKNPYHDVLLELEKGLWEHDVRVEEHNFSPYTYTDEEFRACLKIFLTAFTWKTWIRMEAESIPLNERGQYFKKIGERFQSFIYECTGIDSCDLYENAYISSEMLFNLIPTSPDQIH